MLCIMKGGATFRQLLFDFVDLLKAKDSPGREAQVMPVPRVTVEEPPCPPTDPLDGRDAALEAQGRGMLDEIGLHEGALKLRVVWNTKLRSTAGYAKWPQWLIELNPRLVEFNGQVDRTLKHELAHLVAYARANRRRIEPHGPEWRQACADLGIPDESPRHALPLPQTKRKRNFFYICTACGFTVGRVKKFRRHTACLACCRKHNGGRYDSRFQFVLRQDRKAQGTQTPSSKE